MMQMVGVFAEFEREMIRERTRAGLERARKKGRHPGRKPKLSDDQRQEIRDLVLSGKRTEAEAARLFKVHRSTISRLMREAPDAARPARWFRFIGPSRSAGTGSPDRPGSDSKPPCPALQYAQKYSITQLSKKHHYMFGMGSE